MTRPILKKSRARRSPTWDTQSQRLCTLDTLKTERLLRSILSDRTGDRILDYQILHGVIHTRPYTAHSVWNSVVTRGPMKIRELKVIVKEAGKIEESDYKVFEEALLYCNLDTRPRSAPLEGLAFQRVFYRLFSALYRLCGELEIENIFSDMTDVHSWRRKRALGGVSSLQTHAPSSGSLTWCISTWWLRRFTNPWLYWCRNTLRACERYCVHDNWRQSWRHS